MFKYYGLPPTIRIGCHDVDVKMLDEIIDENGEKYLGEFFGAENELRLVKEQINITYAVETLLHELLHAIYFAWHLNPAEDKEGEEWRVGAIATGLTQVLKDNPKILEWLASALTK